MTGGRRVENQRRSVGRYPDLAKPEDDIGPQPLLISDVEQVGRLEAGDQLVIARGFHDANVQDSPLPQPGNSLRSAWAWIAVSSLIPRRE